jgi:hypothetical protein
MSRKKASRSAGKQDAAPASGGSTDGTQPPRTPHRPVVFVALVLFVPSLWLVLDGNLSVQSALLRFIGALLVSWVAARLVFATMSSFARSADQARVAGEALVAAEARVAGEAGSAGASRAD